MATVETEMDELVTTREAAAMTRYCRPTLLRVFHRVGLRGVRMGTKLLWRKADVLAFIESRREPAGEPAAGEGHGTGTTAA